MKARSRPSLLNADNAICAIGELPWVTSKELAHGRVKSVRDQALGVRRSVGAGDRFNARLFIGLLLGLDPAEQLMLGCAVPDITYATQPVPPGQICCNSSASGASTWQHNPLWGSFLENFASKT